MFCKKGILRNLVKFTRKHLCQGRWKIQLICCRKRDFIPNKSFWNALARYFIKETALGRYFVKVTAHSSVKLAQSLLRVIRRRNRDHKHQNRKYVIKTVSPSYLNFLAFTEEILNHFGAVYSVVLHKALF